MPYKDITKKRANDRKLWRKSMREGARPQQIPLGVIRDLNIKVPRNGLKIAVIPDVQAMANVPLDHLTWCGRYLAEKRPDVIVCIGDFGDFPSLSHFDRDTLEFEGRRYQKDVDAFHRAMGLLIEPISKTTGWRPYMEFTLGNHEDHIRRTVSEDAKLEGLMSLNDLDLPEYGWRVHEFLQPIRIGGVAFCHYYPSGIMGRPITRASAMLSKLHMSAVAGHLPGKDIAFSRRADGGSLAAIIAGSFYQHEYKYLSPFTNAHWRGIVFLHQVKDGAFDEMFVSLDFLKRKFK